MTDLILFLLGGGGCGTWYAWTGYVRRTRPCKGCGGWGYKDRRGIFGTTVRRCGKCGGTGRALRPAARHVQRKRARTASRIRRAAVSAP
jgi:hypothetical protein